MHGQCYTRPIVTFPAKEHHRPLTGTKLYCLVNRGTCVWTTCPRSLPDSALAQSRSWDLLVTSLAHYRNTTKPNYFKRQI